MIEDVVAPSADVKSSALAVSAPETDDGQAAGASPSGPPVERAPATNPTPVVVRQYVRYRGGEARTVEEGVIAEIRLRIVVDGVEIVELMCSPHRVSALVLGFLYHEGIIDGYDDVASVRVCLPDGLAEVWLTRPMPPLPSRRIVTSGCTGGVSFGA